MSEEKKPKKKREKTPTRNAGLPPGPMYPAGTPLNPQTGLPYSDVPIDSHVADRIGYDAESARLNQVVSHVQKRKAAGDTNIRFDAPDPVKYEMCVRENPAGYVRFQMIEPGTDDNIPHKSAVAIDTWPKLIDHLAKNHWKGGRAVYKWWVCDSTNYQKATGKVHFAEREEVEDVSNQPPNNGYPPGYGYGPMMPNPMQGPPPQQQGWPQQQPPPWGYGMPQQQMPMPMPQMMPMPYPMPMPMPMPMQAPQPQQAQQPPAPQPQQQPQVPQMPQYPPMGGMMDPNMVAMLMQLTRENASLIEEVRRSAQQPQQAQPQIPSHLLPFLPYMMSMYQNPYMSMMYPGYGQPAQQQQPPAPKPEEKPEEKLSPIQLVNQSLDMAAQMATLGRKYAEKFAPPERDEPPPPPQQEESLPHTIKELPHMRAVFDKTTGQPVDGVTMLMYNGDKLADAAKGMLKEARGIVKDWSEERDKMITKRREAAQEQARAEEEALQRAERLQRVANSVGVSLPPAPNQVIVNAQGNPVGPSQGSPPNGGVAPAQ
jgi:hypothetical protein